MISAIVGMCEDYGIGYNNHLLYKIPKDMQRFKELTINKAVIMGRKTWESLPIKPLKGRFNVIITSRPKEFEIPKGYEDYVMACTLDDIKNVLSLTQKEYVVIGGGMIYKELLPYVDTLYVTWIHKETSVADTFFPKFLEEDKENWEFVCGDRQWQYWNNLPYKFECYKRPIDFYKK